MMVSNVHRAGIATVLIRAFAIAVLLFLVGPIIIVTILSFSSADTLAFPPPGLSLRWYERFLFSPAWTASLWTSLKLALMTTVFATGLALLASLSLVRGRYRGKRFFYALIFLPMIVPTIITAVALYMFFAEIRATGSILSMALGHTILALPIATMVICAGLQSTDSRLEMAAYSLGASKLVTFYRITLPLIWPSVLTAALFSFLSSFDELLVPLFLGGVRTETLSVRIWNSLLLEVDPVIAAVSTLLVLVTLAILVLVSVLRKPE